MSTKFRLRNVIFSLGLCALCSAAAFFAGRSSVDHAANAASANTKSKSVIVKTVTTDLATSLAQRGITLDSLLKRPGRPDADMLALWASSLSPEDCASALAMLQGLPTSTQRDALFKAVMAAWAKQDPAGFLAASGQMSNPRLREGGITEALRDLAAQNPQAALDWLKQNPSAGSASLTQSRLNSVIAGYAAADPQGAFNYVNAMDEANRQDTKMKTDAFDALADGMAGQGKFTDAIALFSQLPPNGTVSFEAYSSVLDRWGAAAPTDAANWLASQPDLALRNDYISTMTDSWSKSDPAAAATYAAQIEQQELANGTLGQSGTVNGKTIGDNNILADTIQSWAKYDLNAAGQFLNQMPASASKDQAVASFVSTASKTDPASAMAWVNTVTAPQIQQKMMLQVAQQWQQSDPNGFAQYLATATNLTDEQKQALANLPPPASGKNKGNNQNVP